MENTAARQHLICRFHQLLQGEMKALISEQSLLNKDINIATLSTFTWERLSLILHKKSACTVRISEFLDTTSQQAQKTHIGCMHCYFDKLSSKDNSHTSRCISDPVSRTCWKTGEIFFIICSSLVTYFQVFTRLQKLGLCLSSYGTRHVVETLGVDHDSAVRQWMEHLVPSTPTVQVINCSF